MSKLVKCKYKTKTTICIKHALYITDDRCDINQKEPSRVLALVPCCFLFVQPQSFLIVTPISRKQPNTHARESTLLCHLLWEVFVILVKVLPCLSQLASYSEAPVSESSDLLLGSTAIFHGRLFRCHGSRIAERLTVEVASDEINRLVYAA